MSQVIAIPFVLSGDQTHAVIGYRPFGSTDPYSIVMPYPTVSPYNLNVGDGLWDIFVQPSCDRINAPASTIDTLLSVLACGKPNIISAVETSPLDNPKRRVVKVFINIPTGVQSVEWYINDVKVRESLNVIESFEIEDDTWTLANVTVGVKSRCSSSSTSIMVTAIIALTAPDPSIIACPVPALMLVGTTDSSITVDLQNPPLGAGINIPQVELGIRPKGDDTAPYTYITPDKLPYTFTGEADSTPYQVVARVQCSDGVNTVWSNYTAPMDAVTQVPGTVVQEFVPPPFLVVDVIDDTSAKASWDAVDNATGYRLLLKRVSDGVTISETAFAAGQLDYLIAGLTAETEYTAQVKTLYSSAESDYGAPINFTTSVGQGGGSGG